MKTNKHKFITIFLKTASMLLMFCQLSFSQVIKWEREERLWRDDIVSITHNGDVLFAGTFNSGVLRSVDKGQTWEMVNNGLSIGQVELQIRGMASINSWVFLATSRGVFRTNNNGVSWQFWGLKELFIQNFTANGKAVFAEVSTNGVNNDGIYRTTDNGESWQKIKSNLSGLLLVAGDSVWVEEAGGFSFSADGGNTWKSFKPTGYYGNKFCKKGASIYSVDGVFGSNGFSRSDDGGLTWKIIPIDDHVYSMYTLDEWLFAGGYRSKDNGITWEYTGNTITDVATVIGQTLYYSNGRLNQTTNYGKSEKKLPCFYPIRCLLMSYNIGLYAGTDDGYFVYNYLYSDFIHMDLEHLPQQKYLSLSQNNNMIYIGTEDGLYSTVDSLIVPPPYIDYGLSGPVFSIGNNGNTIYAGTDKGIFRRKQGAASWEKMNQVGNQPVRVIVIFNGMLVIGTDNGIFISTNDGQSWTQKNSGLTNTKVQALFVDGDRMIVGTTTGAFLTNNGGNSWSMINNGLTNTNVHCVAILAGKFLAGTDAGVFVSKNKGLSWEQNPTDLIKSVITTFHVYEFGPLGNRLVVGTQMQGAYYIGNFEEFSPVKEQPLATIPEVRLSPNPASDHITIEIEKESNDCRIDLYDLYGSNVGTFNVNGGRSTVRTDNLSSGVYTMRVQYGNKTASKTIAIIK